MIVLALLSQFKNYWLQQLFSPCLRKRISPYLKFSGSESNKYQVLLVIFRLKKKKKKQTTLFRNLKVLWNIDAPGEF